MEISKDKSIYESFWQSRHRDIYTVPMRWVMALRIAGISFLMAGIFINKFYGQTEDGNTLGLVLGVLGGVNLLLAILRRSSIRKFAAALRRQQELHLGALEKVESISLEKTSSKWVYSVKPHGNAVQNIYLTSDNIEHINKFKDGLVIETKNGTVILPKEAVGEKYEEVRGGLVG